MNYLLINGFTLFIAKFKRLQATNTFKKASQGVRGGFFITLIIELLLFGANKGIVFWLALFF